MPPKMTLLEKALASPGNTRRNRPASDEEIELALAWLEGDITLTAATVAAKGELAKGTHSGNYMYRIAYCLQQAYKNGKLRTA